MIDTIQSVDDVFSFIEERTNLESRGGLTRAYRLERMEQLMEELDRPGIRIPTIHIAGSKGKGSTAIILTALLRAAGYTTGLYTSPHLHDYRERIRVYDAAGTSAKTPGGRNLDARILEFGRTLHALVKARSHSGKSGLELPTTFELLTVLAFLIFDAAGCDFIVLETGLGGRLDATNVCEPVATVITPIELEHTDYLGGTVAAIAGEKAGIIKPGVPLFLAPQHPEAMEVILRTAEQRNAPIFRSSEMEIPERVSLPVVGKRQQMNVALALLTATETLKNRSSVPTTIDPQRLLARALPLVELPGRGEVLHFGALTLVLDGAHTEQSITQLVESLIESGMTPVNLIFSAVEGKNARAMAVALAPITKRVHVTRAGTFRKSDPDDLARSWRRAAPEHVPVEVYSDPIAALNAFLPGSSRQYLPPSPSGPLSPPPSGPIVVTGSFYLVAEVRRYVLQLR